MTDDFRAALTMAYERVRKRCSKQWVVLIDLMTHDQTRTYFAKLVSYELAESAYMFPGRNMTVRAGVDLEHKRQILLNTFSTLDRDVDGYLYFANSYSASEDKERRQTEIARQRYLQQTQTYYSDAYATTTKRGQSSTDTAGIGGKKPRYGARAREQHEINLQVLSSML